MATRHGIPRRLVRRHSRRNGNGKRTHDLANAWFASAQKTVSPEKKAYASFLTEGLKNRLAETMCASRQEDVADSVADALAEKLKKDPEARACFTAGVMQRAEFRTRLVPHIVRKLG